MRKIKVTVALKHWTGLCQSTLLNRFYNSFSVLLNFSFFPMRAALKDMPHFTMLPTVSETVVVWKKKLNLHTGILLHVVAT